MPRPNAIELSNKFKRQLADQEIQASERMAIIYNRIYQSLQDEIKRLSDQIADMEDVSQNKIMKLAMTQSLFKQVAEQSARLSGVAHNEIMVLENQAIRAGIDDALKLIEVSLPELPDNVKSPIVASFNRLDPEAIEVAAGLMSADSPLVAKLQEKFGDYVTEQVEKHFLDGMAKGQRADKIVNLLNKNLQNGLGAGLTSLLTTIRTAQIKSYQLANQATYTANAHVISGWVWLAALDDRTCLSCIEQHGTVHPLTETLNDHYNGRCVAVPQTVTYADLGLDIPETIEPIETGSSWFERQPDSVQRDIMGNATYEAYKVGKVGFGDFSRKYDDEVYGELLREASLKDILGQQAKDFYRQ